MPAKGQHQSKEAIKKIKLARSKQVFSKETLLLKSNSMRESWKNPKSKLHSKERSEAIRKHNFEMWNDPNSKVNSKEVKIAQHLQKVKHNLWNAKKEMIQNYDCKCSYCGKKGTTFEIILHHINEDREDNRPENLTLLCRTCHRGETHYTNRYRIKDERGRFI